MWFGPMLQFPANNVVALVRLLHPAGIKTGGCCAPPPSANKGKGKEKERARGGKKREEKKGRGKEKKKRRRERKEEEKHISGPTGPFRPLAGLREACAEGSGPVAFFFFCSPHNKEEQSKQSLPRYLTRDLLTSFLFVVRGTFF